MDTSAQEETRIDLNGVEEEQETSLLEQRGMFLHQPPGSLDEERQEQEPQEDALGNHSEIQALVKDRDPKGVNRCLKVTFEDVIAEPTSVRSFDKVWLWSHALFEVSRLWFYRIISLLLAVPSALLAGVLFGVLSCLHIWLIVPSMQFLLINMHWVRVLWASVLDIAISPFFSSMGKCCGAISIRLAQD